MTQNIFLKRCVKLYFLFRWNQSADLRNVMNLFLQKGIVRVQRIVYLSHGTSVEGHRRKTIIDQMARCFWWFLKEKICGKVFTIPKKVNLVNHRVSGRVKTYKSIIELWQRVFQWFWDKTIQDKVVTPPNKNTCWNKGFSSGCNTLKSIWKNKRKYKISPDGAPLFERKSKE